MPRGSFLEWFFPFYLILSYYSLPGAGSIGQVVLLAYLFVKLLTQKMENYKIPKYYFLFIIVCIPLQCINFSVYGGFYSSRALNLISLFMYLVMLSTFSIDIEKLFHTYKLVSAISSAAIVVQFFQIFILGQKAYPIYLLPGGYPDRWFLQGVRPTGFFPEPQIYATAMLPLLILLLKHTEYLNALLLTLAIMASTSTLGILCAGAIWLYFLLYSASIKQKIAILSVGGLLLLLFLQTSWFEYALEKLTGTDYQNNARLTRGWLVYQNLPLVQKIFGIGMNNINYFIESGRMTFHDRISAVMTNKGYITSAYQILVYWGALGTVLYLLMIFAYYRNSELKIMVLLLCALTFGQTIIFSGIWLFYVMLIQATLKENNSCFINVRMKRSLRASFRRT